MAFPRYTDQQEFGFGLLRPTRAIIVNVASGGSVTIEAKDDNGWVQTDQFTATSAYEVYTQGLQLRITPAGAGTFYSIDKNEGNA